MASQVEVWKLSVELDATMDVQRNPLTITITAPDGFIWIATDCDTISDQADGDDSELWRLIYELMSRGLKTAPVIEAWSCTEDKNETKAHKKDEVLKNTKSRGTAAIDVAKTLSWFAIIIIVIWVFVTVAPVWVTILLAVAFLLWAYG